MAAEQKARSTYEHLIKLTDDQDVKDILKISMGKRNSAFSKIW